MEVLCNSDIQMENQQGKTYIGQVQADCFCQVNILDRQTNPNYVSPSNEERLIGSYIRSWERPGDLPRVIEILCLFTSGVQRNEREDTTISITSGRSPRLSQQRM